MNVMAQKTNTKKQLIACGILVCLVALVLTIVPTFATASAPPELSKLMEQMIGYVGLIFRVVGIILAVYAIGQMIMAFRDENPDAKTKATTLLVVSIILISLPSIIDQLNLQSFLK